jgi:hypothetical protein
MDLYLLLKSFLWLCLSFILYKLHKWWQKYLIKTRGALNEYEKNTGALKSWGLIIMPFIMSILYFLKAIHLIS